MILFTQLLGLLILGHAEEPNICTVSYIQNRIEVEKANFTSEKMIPIEREDFYLDQRIVGFDESTDEAILTLLKDKGYEPIESLAGEIVLRKFEVSIKEENFKKHLFINYSLLHAIPGIESKEQTSSLGFAEKISQKKQASDVADFLIALPSCEELKKAAALAADKKKKQDEKKENDKESEISAYQHSVGGYDGLESLFVSLSTERESAHYLGDWKPFTKAHLDETTNESKFNSIAFDGEPNLHFKKEQIEKNKLLVDIGCTGGYADLAFVEGELKFSHWNCNDHWSFYHCKYNDKDDSFICNIIDEKSDHSYVVYRRYDPFK